MNPKSEIQTPKSAHPNAKRTDVDYLNESLANGLLVLEALEGMNFEPINITRVAQRTGLPYDFCMRALRTLRHYGWARESTGGWTLTAKYLAFRQRAAAAAKAHQSSEISEL